jgi:hypothetical protein
VTGAGIEVPSRDPPCSGVLRLTKAVHAVATSSRDKLAQWLEKQMQPQVT